MGCHGDRSLRHYSGLPNHQGPYAQVDHAESSEVRSDGYRNCPVLPPPCIRTDHNRHSNERKHLPEELNVLHSSEIPYCDLHHALAHRKQEAVELGDHTLEDCRHQNPEEAKEQDRSDANA